MHGGNRRFLVASTLLALPTALLMVSLSNGSGPSKEAEITHAVAYSGDQSGEVQQVVGKQIDTRKTRPGGILRALTGGSPSSSSTTHSTHQHQHQDPPRGLLDGLFDRESSSERSASSTRSTHRHTSDVHNREAANWDGIPYHRVDASGQRSSTSPIRDPNSTSRSGTSTRSNTTTGSVAGTRIIRGGSSRTIQAQPASVRRQPTLAVQPEPAIIVPRVAVAGSGQSVRSTNLSSNTSSRRSGRRSVDVLDASEIAAASKTPVVETGTNDLVPKITRREMEEPAVTSKPVEAVAQAKPAKSAPQPTKAALTKTAPVKTEPAKTQTAQAQPKLEPAPEQPSTALAAISRESEPKSAGDANVPSTTLSPPTPSIPPAYTKPVDPNTQPVPIAGIPSHPYAASTPATTPSLPVAHRIGPPQSAFSPIGNSGQETSANTVSTPVGSGVMTEGDVATFRRPAAAVAPGAQVDPYAASTTPYPTVPYQGVPYQPAPSNRMSTFGQPVATAPDERVAARPPHETATIPMHPISGDASAATKPVAAPQLPQGRFTESKFDARGNQMRTDYPSGNLPPGMNAVASELPGIRVTTNGPDAIMIRQTIQYEIRVDNRGSIDAEGLMIRATVPDWAELRGQNATQGDIDTQTQGSTERLVWTIDHLPAGASQRMFVRLMAARSGTYDLDVDWTMVPQKSVARVQVHEPKLGLSIDGPDSVVFGQSQTYKVRVLNPGDGTAPNVVFTLSPNSATPQTQRIGDIPPGKEAQFDVELTAQDLGDLKIHGLAAGDLELRAESSKTIRVAAAKLEAMLTGPELKYQNTESMYNLEVKNTGVATSEKIVAKLLLPVGVKYLGGVEEAELRGHTLNWEITALAPGATRNYQFRCNMSATGEHLFAFDCKGTAAGSTEVALATRVESIADLVLSISDPTAPAPIGTDVTYEIVIRNRGSKEATDVRAVAQFSHGIEPKRIEGQSGEIVTGQVLFDAIPRVAAGQEIRMRVIAQAETAGHHRFRTEVRSGDTVLVAEEATHYMSPTSERVSRRSTDAAKR